MNMMNKQSQESKTQPIKGTNFLVTILHTENHSYQGVIQWLDTGEKIHFRSELELITLIRSAVSRHTEDDQCLRDWGQAKNISAS
jgi:alpha-D-ribose 1-methylphosphonate 5-triphosphate synthase subunit PhnI